MLIHGVSWNRKEDTKTLVGSYLDSVQMVIFFTSSGFSNIYEDTNTLGGSYLDSGQIVPHNHQKHHTLPADVLPSASEDLFTIFKYCFVLLKKPSVHVRVVW